jgi:hypothetical protein
VNKKLFSLEGCCSTIELHPRFQWLTSFNRLYRWPFHGPKISDISNEDGLVAQGVRDNVLNRAAGLSQVITPTLRLAGCSRRNCQRPIGAVDLRT